MCSYSDADELYDCFVTESFKRIGEVMIFDMVTVAQEFMTSESDVHMTIGTTILYNLINL